MLRLFAGPGLSAELFISRKAVEYHLGNIYAKCGLQGRQQLRRFVERWRQPAGLNPHNRFRPRPTAWPAYRLRSLPGEAN